MFEIFVTFIFTVLIQIVDVFWLDVFFLGLMLVLILPGVYAMVSGAPFVPTSDRSVMAMLELGKFRRDDRVVDIGCGDGKLVRAIAGAGVKSAVGYEFSIPTYLWARIRSFFGGKGEKIVFANFWKKDFGQVDVVACFLLTNAMGRFEKEIWPKLKKGSRVLSNIFKLKHVKPVAYKDGIYLYVK